MKYTKEKFKTYQDVFDKFTENNLYELYTKKIIDSLLYEISIGKEANVFLAQRNNEKIILKIYRLETNDFNNMRYYLISDPRFANTKKSKRNIIFNWAKREYKNLMLCFQNNISCPKPLFFKDNILIMDLIGKETPAPKLKDSLPRNPIKFFEEIKDNIKKLYKLGYIHGDLSEYNILNNQDKPIFIDFSHMTPLKSPIAMELLDRDVKNIKRFFIKKFGKKEEFNISIEEIIKTK